MTKPLRVVGAGPVGLTLASELARYRVPVRVVDNASVMPGAGQNPVGAGSTPLFALFARPTMEITGLTTPPHRKCWRSVRLRKTAGAGR
jgi:cation diffusion facilitator CzcD-associated flavoprotein CzcO